MSGKCLFHSFGGKLTNGISLKSLNEAAIDIPIGEAAVVRNDSVRCVPTSRNSRAAV